VRKKGAAIEAYYILPGVEKALFPGDKGARLLTLSDLEYVNNSVPLSPYLVALTLNL